MNTSAARRRATCDTRAGIRGSAAERVSLHIGCRRPAAGRRRGGSPARCHAIPIHATICLVGTKIPGLGRGHIHLTFKKPQYLLQYTHHKELERILITNFN